MTWPTGMEPIDPEPFIERAQGLVDQQEAVYRYPVELIARPFNGHTYCDFGYLDPVHDLHFWRRELAQLRNDRWGPFYKNIWNIPRTHRLDRLSGMHAAYFSPRSISTGSPPNSSFSGFSR